MAGMGRSNVEEYSYALEGETTLRPNLERWARELTDLTANTIAAALGGLASDVDKAALTGEFGEFTAESFRAAVSSGAEGWLEDDLAFVNYWGFELSAIQVPVALWQGSEDLMVPPAHGRWLATNMPRARTHFVDGEGHISLLRHADEVLADLLELAGLRQPA